MCCDWACLFFGECVGIVIFSIAAEGAEGAAGGADVGVVYIAVDDVGADAVAVDMAAAGVCVAAEFGEGLELEEFETLLGRETSMARGDR